VTRMHIKTEIPKDYELPASTSAITTKSQTRSQYGWDSFLISMRATQLATTLSNSKVYELAVKCGVSCQCCDRIPKESITCLSIEKQQRSHKPERPSLRRGLSFVRK
jgi:hypothetical protein